MFRFIVFLLVVSCSLTGYRLLGQTISIANLFEQAAFAQSALLATSATEQTDTAVSTVASTPAPTVAPLFRPQPTVAPVLAFNPILIPTTTPEANTQPTTLQTMNEAIGEPSLYLEIPIYDDELDSHWTIEHSVTTQTNLWDTSHWFQTMAPQQDINSGATAIAVSPQADFGTLFFTVRADSTVGYKREDVLGVSFWLNSGSSGLETDDLSVAILGSNQSPYWMADDRSVFPDPAHSFSETRLYFLEINRTIPPHTWINVVVWLNKLQYDPAYRYVTGFYLKNDAGFRNTYYLDQIALVMAP